ncbi:alpha/beta hydrolase fold domain-containing protein [Streptomyces sp. NPDC090025]|uniref:alpha/beta hydrolase fold domain-containing protein n=1 Tax=Streptomyces sp. NPDC090025 TaxID=3365922 RepID=UPI003838ADDE
MSPVRPVGLTVPPRPVRLPLPVVRALLHPFFRAVFRPGVPWSAQRLLLDAFSAGQPLPRGTRVDRLALGARRAERVTVGPVGGPGAVLHLHGGGYTVGSLATHRSFAAHLAAATRRPVYLLDYRLAPEHPYPAALEDTLAAIEALARTEEHPAGTLALTGDSAGGGIALAAAQRLTAAAGAGDGTGAGPETGDGSGPAAATGRPGAPVLAALGLVSPWADPGEVADGRRDLVVSRAWGLACAAAYLGEGDPDDPRFAPLKGPLGGLPPVYLHTNRRELLYAQGLRLAAALRRAGVPVTLVESATLWHAAQAQAGLVAEAAASVRDLAVFLSARWTRPGEGEARVTPLRGAAARGG